MKPFRFSRRPCAGLSSDHAGPLSSLRPSSLVLLPAPVRSPSGATPLAIAIVFASALLLLTSSRARAQVATELPAVVVTGNPLGADEIVSPVSVVTGAELQRRQAATLGETLDNLPGVSQTGFGPNSSRPIIRGLDGDRIRILRNSGASFDASSLSYDHAVPIDPAVVDRIEVLRGPAALLYGGSAVGGVVNTIDNRIPTSSIDRIQGRAEVRGGGAASEAGGTGVLEAGAPLGSGMLNIHTDFSASNSDDLRVPRFTRPDGEVRKQVENSAGRKRGAALGASITRGDGYFGASVDTFDNRYGVVVEPEVTIRMKSDRFAVAGEKRDPVAGLKALRFRIGAEDYEHTEFEGDEIGTVFRSRGQDLRVEAEHLALGPVRGVVGLQIDRSRFSALGEEAFVPSTHSRSNALFVVEELPFTGGKLNLGARLEQARIRSAGDSPTGADDPDSEPGAFGAPTRRSFSPRSIAAGALFDLSDRWQLTGNLSRTERAPTQYELFANGVHVATAAFERGDTSLGKEKATTLDLGLTWKSGPNRVRFGVYSTRFSNYIGLDLVAADSGEFDEEGEQLPLFAFQAVPARFNGAEVDGVWRMLDGAWQVDVLGRIDTVRATNRATGEPLPRIVPLRTAVALQLRHNGLAGTFEVVNAVRQSRVPGYDESTDGYTLVNLWASYRLPFAGNRLQLFARVNNLTDRLAFNAASIQTVRGLSPLAGRSLLMGLRGTL